MCRAMCFGIYGGYVRKGNTARPGQLAPIRPVPAQVLLQPLLTLRWPAFRYLLIYSPLNSHSAHLFSCTQHLYFLLTTERHSIVSCLCNWDSISCQVRPGSQPRFDGLCSDADPRCKIVLPLHSTRRRRNDIFDTVEAINAVSTTFLRRFPAVSKAQDITQHESCLNTWQHCTTRRRNDRKKKWQEEEKTRPPFASSAAKKLSPCTPEETQDHRLPMVNRHQIDKLRFPSGFANRADESLLGATRLCTLNHLGLQSHSMTKNSASSPRFRAYPRHDTATWGQRWKCAKYDKADDAAVELHAASYYPVCQGGWGGRHMPNARPTKEPL